MNKRTMKTMVAAVCVVAAGMGGFKAYNAANHSEAEILLSENVEALSANNEISKQWGYHKSSGRCKHPSYKFWVTCSGWIENGDPYCLNSDC